MDQGPTLEEMALEFALKMQSDEWKAIDPHEYGEFLIKQLEPMVDKYGLRQSQRAVEHAIKTLRIVGVIQ